MEKTQQLAAQMNISYDDLKVVWFIEFRHYQCLNIVSLNGEGGAIDQNDLELLASLEMVYVTVHEYVLGCVYNMDETSLFFLLIPRYTMLLPNETPATI